MKWDDLDMWRFGLTSASESPIIGPTVSGIEQAANNKIKSQFLLLIHLLVQLRKKKEFISWMNDAFCNCPSFQWTGWHRWVQVILFHYFIFYFIREKNDLCWKVLLSKLSLLVGFVSHNHNHSSHLFEGRCSSAILSQGNIQPRACQMRRSSDSNVFIDLKSPFPCSLIWHTRSCMCHYKC